MDDKSKFDNVTPFPVSRKQKIERVARAMADAENGNDRDWETFIAQAITALEIVDEI